MDLWLVVLGMGVITFALRLTLILGANRFRMPLALQQGLKFAPPAVLSAIIALEVIAPADRVDLNYTNFRLVAGLVAMLVAWRTRNVLLTIAVGMVTLWLLEWLGSMGGI